MTKILYDIIETETGRDVAAPVQILCEEIRARYPAVQAVLFYGSGLWKAAEDDTVYDFYALFDCYRDSGKGRLHAALGSWLAPNVYYMETKKTGGYTAQKWL